MTEGASVEVVYRPSGDPAMLVSPWRVLVNGTDVGLVAEDGIIIEPGSNSEWAKVTLVLLPASVVLREGTE